MPLDPFGPKSEPRRERAIRHGGGLFSGITRWRRRHSHSPEIDSEVAFKAAIQWMISPLLYLCLLLEVDKHRGVIDKLALRNNPICRERITGITQGDADHDGLVVGDPPMLSNDGILHDPLAIDHRPQAASHKACIVGIEAALSDRPTSHPPPEYATSAFSTSL